MPEKTKENSLKRGDDEKKSCPEIETGEKEENSSWADDQKKRGYYYDDAHGYQIYNPDEDEDDED
jgi:hypothetical protein